MYYFNIFLNEKHFEKQPLSRFQIYLLKPHSIFSLLYVYLKIYDMSK